jgi:hypothetical protein
MNTAAYSIIVPVWGTAHVSRFLDWVLPTWLAPGNLPELAARSEAELILLAPKADLERITAHGTVSRLRDICRLELIEIDDLVPGAIATVTLTLAFVRGARAALAQGQRRLIFLNADFVLADGSVAAIARRFDAGQKLLLCSSIRAREELVVPELNSRRQVDDAIVVPSREAVRLALDAQHPTALACRADQPLLHSSHPNQFFWRIDSTSLLLRAFLLFPLAVEPETSPGPADTYCDYGWIGTLAPQASVEIVDSSDELFIIELAPSGQESGFVRAGVLDPAEAARGISVWANAFSRPQPLTPIIFHSEELSEPAMKQASERSRAFIADLLQRLGSPKPVSNHPFWIGGAAAYIRNRKEAGITAIPQEMAVPSETSLPLDLLPENLVLNSTLRSIAKKVLVGRPNDRRRWHPYWAFERRIKALGPMRITGDPTVGGRLSLPMRGDGTPTAVIDLRDIRELDGVVQTLASEVPSGDRAYMIVEQGPSGSNDLLYLNERIALFAQIDKFFRLVSERTLVTGVEERAANTHRRLASDIQLVSLLRSIGLTLASGLAMAGTAWRNWRFDWEASDSPKDAVFIFELKRY